MKYSYSIHVRCACPKGQRCVELWRKDGSWNSRHGSAGYACRVPTSTGTRLLKRFGYASKAEAKDAADHVGRLLDLGTDDATRTRIGDMIAAAKRGAGLPAVDDVRRRLGLELDPGQQGVMVADWLQTWLASRRRIRASMTRSYQQHIDNWLVPHLGQLPLERLNADHISGLFATIDRFNAEIERQRAEGSAAIQIDGDVRSQPRIVGPTTQRRIFATLRAALNAAVRQRRIMFNPCAGVELAPEAKAERQRWTPAEARRFIDCAADDSLGLMFRIAVLRGARRGELCGLQWSGADLDNGVLIVDHTILELGGRLVNSTPKTRAGERRIYLDAETTGLLQAHRKAQLAARLRAGVDWQDHDLIFCRYDGTPWRPSYVTRQFERLAQQAEVPVITLHEGGRHTANSLMRDAGVDQELRMREIGRSDKAVNDRYTHKLDAAHRAAAQQVADLVKEA